MNANVISSNFEGYSILIVDDNPTNLGVVVDYLEEYGFEILIARNGLVGLNRAQQTQPDIILLDVIMPNLDGFEVCRRLKADASTADIPVIFMTALSNVEDKLKGFQLGAVDYVTKPIQQAEVLVRITNHLKISDLTQQLGQQNSRLQYMTEELSKANQKLSERVDEEKERVRDLAERNLVISKAVEASSDAVAMVDTHGTTTYINPTFYTLFGFTLAELNKLGGPSAIFVNTRQAKKMQNAFEHGQSWSEETDLYTKTGHRITTLFRTNAIFDQQRQIVGAVHLITDISERKAYTYKLDQANQELERLLYIITHDLKEPLGAIQSFADLISIRYETKLDAKGHDYLNRVKKAGKRLRTMLDHIRTLLHARRIELPSATTDSRLLVDEAIQLLKNEIKQSNATIDIHAELPQLQVNRTWAVQALYHLIANALKYTTHNQPPKIEILPYHRSKETGLIVKDYGCGVSSELHKRIFQLFQRGVSRKVTGTGAGLTIVRRIALQHGGNAWVQTPKTGGSEFVITFGQQ